MKLIKINTDHYVVVADSEIKEGDWTSTEENTIHQVDYVDAYTKINGWKKITHSTQPLEEGTTIHDIEHKRWILIKYIDLQEIKELIGEVDIWQKFKEIDGSCQKGEYEHWLFESGYNQALEDNKEKKYTEEDLKRYHNIMCLHGNKKGEEFIQSLQPKTEWEVEFDEQGKLKLV